MPPPFGAPAWVCWVQLRVCELDFDLRHFDVDAIFVQSKLDADVFLYLLDRVIWPSFR